MKYLDYKEHRKHGTLSFPFAFYKVNPHHPRYNMTYHWHMEYEIIRILSGKFNLTIGEEEYCAYAGDLFFITGGMLHGGIPTDCNYECFVFDLKTFLKNNQICSEEIDAILKQENNIQVYFSKDITEIQKSVYSMFKAVSSHKKGYQLLVQGALYQFLGYVIEHNYYAHKTFFHVQDKKKISLYKAILSFIELHYQESLSLEDLASCAGMNPNYFCKFFKELTHQSPIEYLNYYRVECACEQLSSTDKSITDIALDCGFNDVSYFVKVFKKYKGSTPSKYLKTFHS